MLTTMLIIGLLALLVLTQMKSLLLNAKNLGLLKKRQQIFWTLETVAQQIMQKNVQRETGLCFLAERDPNEVVDLLKNTRGCSLIQSKQVFHYLIEDLGFVPSSQLKVNNPSYCLRHFRLTVQAHEKPGAILQLRYAKKAGFKNCTALQLKLGKPGLLSWRYLPRGNYF
ncbi:MAG: hypothetical protein H0U70_04965 [Tatlockia sp.]|nr:hypothetical protein [Tatlockia sp.]